MKVCKFPIITIGSVLFISYLILPTLAFCRENSTAREFITQKTISADVKWQKFQGKGFSLTLPASFKQEMERNSVYQKSIESANLAFLAIDKNTKNSPIGSNVSVLVTNLPSKTSFSDFFRSITDQLPTGIQVLDQKFLQSTKYQVGQIITEWSFPQIKLKQAIYLIKHKNKIYTITYTTSLEQFPDRYPDFQRSIYSFLIDGT